MSDDIPRILTTADVMRLMKWSDQDAVYRQVKAGRLVPVPNVKPFRFTRESFLAFLSPPEPLKTSRTQRKTPEPFWTKNVARICN